MPEQFTRPNFNAQINQTMNFVKRLVSEEPLDSERLLDCLLPLERKLINYYQDQLHSSPQDARVNGQKTYRQFIQYVLCLAYENNKNEQVCQDILTFSMCSPLFYFEREPGVNELSFWFDQSTQSNLLSQTVKRGFPDFIPSLLKDAEQALQKTPTSEDSAVLRRFFVFHDFKAMLLTQLQVALAPHWKKYEKHLIEQAFSFFRHFSEYQYQRASERLISNRDDLLLTPEEIDNLIEWTELLRQEVLKLLEAHQDPISFTSLLDKENESVETGGLFNLRNLPDPLCFLPDEQPYFLSTFKNLYATSEGGGGGVFQSPVSKQTIVAHAYESTSMEALLALSQGIISLKEQVLLNNRINVNQAITLMLGDNEFRSREFTAVPEPSAPPAELLGLPVITPEQRQSHHHHHRRRGHLNAEQDLHFPPQSDDRPQQPVDFGAPARFGATRTRPIDGRNLHFSPSQDEQRPQQAVARHHSVRPGTPPRERANPSAAAGTDPARRAHEFFARRAAQDTQHRLRREEESADYNAHAHTGTTTLAWPHPSAAAAVTDPRHFAQFFNPHNARRTDSRDTQHRLRRDSRDTQHRLRREEEHADYNEGFDFPEYSS